MAKITKNCYLANFIYIFKQPDIVREDFSNAQQPLLNCTSLAIFHSSHHIRRVLTVQYRRCLDIIYYSAMICDSQCRDDIVYYDVVLDILFKNQLTGHAVHDYRTPVHAVTGAEIGESAIF